MTLMQLQYFRVLAKVLHYTKASQELHISQPNLSYAIAELEKELGVNLFEKVDKKIKLSQYGEYFLTYVEQALDIMEDGVKRVRAIKGATSGEVHLGYIYSLAASLIPSVIEGFQKEEENTGISFKFKQNLQNNLLEDLKTGKIDLAFCVEEDPTTVSIPIFEQELFLVVSKEHPLAEKEEIEIAEVADLPFVLLHQDSGLRKLVVREFEKRGFSPKVVFEAYECNATLQFVSLNFGVTIIPGVPGIEYSPVAKIKIKTPGFKRKIYLSWMNKGTLIPPVRKVRDYILENFNVGGSSADEIQEKLHMR